MTRFMFTFLFYALVLLSGQTFSVKVSVYYEALCPDSVRFICLQLYPNYKLLKDHIQLELIPFGKATHNKFDEKWHFDCQHGEQECKSNKYQTCAISTVDDPETHLNYVNCVMRERNPASLRELEKCARRFDFNWDNITQCATNTLGDELYAKNGDKTNALEPNLSYVPTIIYDGIYDDFLQAESLSNFAGAVCSKIDGDKPTACAGKRLTSMGWE